MRNTKQILIIICGMLLGVSIYAQQVPMYSQYIMNGFLINPSYAGNDGYTTLNLTAREQWLGIPSSPSTYAVSFQTRWLKNSYIQKSTNVRKEIVKPTRPSRVGLGGYIFNDRNGIIRRTGFSASYAYHIEVGSYGSQLSFGLASTVYQFAIDLDGAIVADIDDEFLNNYDRVVIIPDFNFGLSYTSQNYYLGFSATQLFRGTLTLGNTAKNPRTELGHFFLSGGAKIPLSGNEWVLEPSALVKTSDMILKAAQVDFTTRIYYRQDYWAGISYRTQDAVIMMIGFTYDKFYFAYAFDLALTDIRQHSYGSHELSFAVKFGDNARRYRWLNQY
ncbi:MAG TPA: type IX secretion system membrane protein PorP/SprF [Bacteroidetes bacterium]|nr:type IX secretion system membrane protein PorP/SprF [Bacteroidota bacterium]